MKKISNIWQNRKAIAEGIKNSIVKDETIELIAEQRRVICNSCPELNNQCNSAIKDCCGVCGCMIEFKTRSMQSSCPNNKWSAVKSTV
jgi:hypothetical protein